MKRLPQISTAFLFLAFVACSEEPAQQASEPAQPSSGQGTIAQPLIEPEEEIEEEVVVDEDAGSAPATYAALEGVTMRNASTFGAWVFGGQPSEADLETLKARGVTKVIDLRMPSEERGYDEPAACAALGLEYVAHPFAPQAIGEGVVEGVLEELKLGGETLVHCASGNRVQLMFSMHRVLEEGVDVEEAIADGIAQGMSEGSASVARRLLRARGD